MVSRVYNLPLKTECKNFGSRYYTGVVIENGNRNGTTKPGENITLVCDQGFRKISKEMVRYCLDDGQWDNIENPCRGKNEKNYVIDNYSFYVHHVVYKRLASILSILFL